MSNLMRDVHEGLQSKLNKNDTSESFRVCGTYKYYHYECDGFDDRGWGCGYRTLQTICSWLNNNLAISRNVPSITEIQQILIEVQDKPKTFLRSRQWIGSFEVCLVIDHLYDIPCKILHVNKGEELCTIIDALKHHFINFGSPVMMGGDVDCSSKGIMGVHIDGSDVYLLIVDPHYVGPKQTKAFIQNKGYVKWQPLKDFNNNSFYNLCLPQAKHKGIVAMK